MQVSVLFLYRRPVCFLTLLNIYFFPQDLVRKGIPHHFRAIVWQLLCNAQNMPIKDQYSELLKMTSPCEKLIRRDIARTYPEHEFFKEKDSLGQEVLFNVMKVSLSFVSEEPDCMQINC